MRRIGNPGGENEGNTLQSPPHKQLPSPLRQATLPLPVRGARFVPLHPLTPVEVTLGDPTTPPTQYYVPKHTFAKLPLSDKIMAFNLSYSFALGPRGPTLI